MMSEDLLDASSYVLADAVEPVGSGGYVPASVEVVDADGVISDHQQYVTPEGAFKAYAVQTDRSLRKLADLLGVPRGTILGWSSKYAWRDRIRELDLERVEGITETVAVVLVQQSLKNLETLIQIRDLGETDRVRLEAAKELTNQFNRYQDRAMLASLSSGADDSFLEDSKLEELAQTADGVRQLLQHLRDSA